MIYTLFLSRLGRADSLSYVYRHGAKGYGPQRNGPSDHQIPSTTTPRTIHPPTPNQAQVYNLSSTSSTLQPTKGHLPITRYPKSGWPRDNPLLQETLDAYFSAITAKQDELVAQFIEKRYSNRQRHKLRRHHDPPRRREHQQRPHGARTPRL